MQIKHRPISYRFLERSSKNGSAARGATSSFYCQALFEEVLPETLISRKECGAIGIDFNADHLAVTEVDRYGNPIAKFSLAFQSNGKSSGQITAMLGDHVAAIIDLAKKTGKIVVCEALDFAKEKAALREQGGKQYRAMLSSLAYKKFFAILQARAARNAIEVKTVNAAFTSLIGHYKFFGYLAYTSHELAALSIARRGLGLSERSKIKNTLFATVSMQGIVDVSARRPGVRHIWSHYSRNAQAIRNHIRQTSTQSRGFPISANPRYPSGYHAIVARIRRDRMWPSARPP